MHVDIYNFLFFLLFLSIALTILSNLYIDLSFPCYIHISTEREEEHQANNCICRRTAPHICTIHCAQYIHICWYIYNCRLFSLFCTAIAYYHIRKYSFYFSCTRKPQRLPYISLYDIREKRKKRLYYITLCSIHHKVAFCILNIHNNIIYYLY
jgi:hypothetical protein